MDALNFIPSESHSNGLAREPTEFLQHLASQSEILACLGWLGEFQILACIPLAGSVLISDVAELSGVPEKQLSRIIRLVATACFLSEPQPGYVAHTALSAPFVSNPSFLDAAMFLAESAAPAALQMAPATQRFGDSQQPHESAYNVALNAETPFHSACKERPKLRRQWSAYLQYAGGLHATSNVAEVLLQLNWNWSSSIGTACARIVEVGAQSTATSRSIAALYPSVQLLVQMTGDREGDPAITPTISVRGKDDSLDQERELSSRISIAHRAPGTRQTATDAALFILHLPSTSPSAILAELHAHLAILSRSSAIMLILTGRLLPEPGSTTDSEIEAMARSRDLSLRQLANDGEMEMAELLEIIDEARDSAGKLVVTNKLRSRKNLVVALVVKYQIYADCSPSLQPL